MAWYDQGFDGMAQEQQRLDEMQGPGRIWMPPGVAKQVVHIDDEPFCCHEHNPKMGGNFRNWFTCIRDVHPDNAVCCQMLGDKSRYYTGFLTVVDCSKWQDGRGSWHQYEMRLIQYKMRSLKKLRRKKEDRGTLVGTLWTLTREDDKSPTCGDDWEFKRDVDLDKLFQLVCYRGTKLTELWAEAAEKEDVMERVKRTFQIQPVDGKLPESIPAFNYFEVLKPKSPRDIRIFLGGAEKEEKEPKVGGYGSGSSGGGGSVREDEVPF
jgi:hypothetical protein